MATYVIGDVQGCYAALQALLHTLNFNTNQDQLWFVGDLVNRGPDSLGVLRFVKQLGEQAITVLGNHDLHLLAIANGLHRDKAHDLAAILTAPDRDLLLDWLRHRPFLHQNTHLGYTLIHAGLPPQWTINQAQHYADELQSVLRGADYPSLLANMYGDEPQQWSDDLQGWERLRFICNCFTRLRYCTAAGRVALHLKGPPGSQPRDYTPWYEITPSRPRQGNIVFGHWSTLGIHRGKNVYALDSGCVWGGQLSALRIDVTPPRLFQVDCPAGKHPGAPE
ncbi:MAG: symmetrical bis(5'-nucleosyl)-tetraphosphatase [Gammaproteobacteria bacterium]|nr:symmetrical bis(5'-nucleosyl)-tetraphosphatase [Gammaproteobacteria bacterium]